MEMFLENLKSKKPVLSGNIAISFVTMACMKKLPIFAYFDRNLTFSTLGVTTPHKNNC